MNNLVLVGAALIVGLLTALLLPPESLIRQALGRWWRVNRAYGTYVWRHKVAVYRAGRLIGVGRWRLLTHDLSKLRLDEWRAYAWYFNGGPFRLWRDVPCYVKQNHFEYAWATSKEGMREAFDHAWRRHQLRNDHHWQHWVLHEDSGEVVVLRMPYDCWREMVSDWMAAGMAIKGHSIESALRETRLWYEKNKDQIMLHPDTRASVERTLVCE